MPDRDSPEGVRPRLVLRKSERPILRLTRQESHSTSATDGQRYWDQITPYKRALLEEPIREIEKWLASHYPERFKTPLIDKARNMLAAGQLEVQADPYSCTFVAAANALRVLDQPRPEYSSVAIKGKIHELMPDKEGDILESGMRVKEFRTVLKSGYPYNQFDASNPVLNKNPQPSSSYEMLELFEAIQKGDLAVAGWPSRPEKAVYGRGFLKHQRAIVGFSTTEDKRIILVISDPYGRIESWSFRDWIAARRLYEIFNNPTFTTRDVRQYVNSIGSDGGVINAIAQEVIIVQKNPT